MGSRGGSKETGQEAIVTADNSHASQGGEEDGFKVPSKSRTSNTEDDIDIAQSCLQRDL